MASKVCPTHARAFSSELTTSDRIWLACERRRHSAAARLPVRFALAARKRIPRGQALSSGLTHAPQLIAQPVDAERQAFHYQHRLQGQYTEISKSPYFRGKGHPGLEQTHVSLWQSLVPSTLAVDRFLDGRDESAVFAEELAKPTAVVS